jgi:hypothetical protein
VHVKLECARAEGSESKATRREEEEAAGAER